MSSVTRRSFLLSGGAAAGAALLAAPPARAAMGVLRPQSAPSAPALARPPASTWCSTVSLTDHSTWTVTGKSYLTSLSLDATSAVAGAHGRKVTMTVDGAPAAITPGGSYAGAIVITPA